MVSVIDVSDKASHGLPDDKVPQHVAVIMDGNGRWARKRGLPRLAGHRAGTENLREVISACVEFGVKILTIYAFSTENWGRPQSEVNGLLAILREVIDKELAELNEEGVQLRHLGDLSRLNGMLRDKVERAIDLTKDNDRLILNVAFNYGGRAEIVQAVKQIVENGHDAGEVDEALISQYLYTGTLPDPDLIIRTSGELRLSNFLIWQAAYSEYYSAPEYWPDFNRDALLVALQHYCDRDRRFGLVNEQ